MNLAEEQFAPLNTIRDTSKKTTAQNAQRLTKELWVYRPTPMNLCMYTPPNQGSKDNNFHLIPSFC